MARQTFEFDDDGRKIIVNVRNPGNTYVTIITNKEDDEYIDMRLKTFRKINNAINKAHWKDYD